MRTPDIIAKKQVLKVAEEVSIYIGVDVSEIFGESREKLPMRARRLTYYLSHIVYDLSYSAIARAFDHSSYSAEEKGIKQMEAWVHTYPMVNDTVEYLRRVLQPSRAKNLLPLRFKIEHNA